MKAVLAMIAALVALAGCNINTPAPTPTVQPLITQPATDQAVTPTASLTPSPTPGITSSPPALATTLPTSQPAVPTAPAEIVPTEGPYVYVIQPDDTLGYILQLQPWGYPPFDQGVIAAVVQLNNLASPNLLPAPGTELLIPRRTATPTPEGASATATSDAAIGVGERIGNITLPQGAVAGCHTVVAGDSIISIADQYNTTLETLSQLNQNLNWFGCQFDQYSGGPRCRPFITVGQCVNVPLPTPTPVPSATPSGSETPTPTPTYEAPRGFYPPDGAAAPPVPIRLSWVSVGQLGRDEVYFVEVQDTTLNTQWQQVTRNTAITLPDALIPTDGQPHQMRWRVTVARRGPEGFYDYIGAVGQWRTFQWFSR
jgi:LysM repeat protein